MKSKLFILPILLWLSLLASGCTSTIFNWNISNTGNVENTTWEIVWIANPASVYCEENGWTLEIIFDNGESYGMCHFPNWSVCEEREFFHKECFPASEDDKKIDEVSKNELDKNNPVICTMDAKQCPDWSYVWRIWPNCEFEECPTTENTWDNNEKIAEEETITEILENHAKTSWYQEEWLTEDDIDLMEAIIEKLK
jgi:putative hemolysin